MRHTTLSLHRNAHLPDTMPDVRGYEVRTRDNDKKVGKVGDLVCAPDGRMRYLDVELGGIFNRKRVLLPVGLARLDRQNDIVWVAGMTKEEVRELPDYDGNPDTVTEDYEQQCCGPFLGRGMATEAGVTSPAELHDQGRFYADRGGAAAGAGRVDFGDDEDATRASAVRRGPSASDGGEARP